MHAHQRRGLHVSDRAVSILDDINVLSSRGLPEGAMLRRFFPTGLLLA